MAGHPVVFANVPPLGDTHAALIDGDRAARVEIAARGRPQRARHVACQDDALAPGLHNGVRNRHGGKERLRVRVERVLIKLRTICHLGDPAQIHDRHAIADMPDDRQIVGDEEIGQPEIVLQILEQIDDLRLNRDVERRDRFVANDEVRLDGEGTRDADALPLPAAELVRIAIGVVGIKPDDAQQLLHPLLARLALRQAVNRKRLRDDAAHRHTRVERSVGILKDHLHAPAKPS